MVIILGVAALALVLVLGMAAKRPDSFRVERSIQIEASPERIFEHLESFSRWAAWSPWEKLDPAMKRQYTGAERGVGAQYHWLGNKQVGEGKMEILALKPAEQLLVKLDFIKPFTAHNTAEFTLSPTVGRAGDAPSCQVTWAMYGPSPFVSKLMGLFFNLDKLVGKDFESGLVSLKHLSEQARVSQY